MSILKTEIVKAILGFCLFSRSVSKVIGNVAKIPTISRMTGILINIPKSGKWLPNESTF